MSSGNFPVREDSVEGCKLLAASDLVTEVINALGADYSQYDDAERYGGSIALFKVDINRRGKTIPAGAELWMIGTDTAKDWLFSRWLLPGGPGSIHFNRDLPDTFYDQLTAERKLIRYVKGFQRAEYVKSPGDANEALDLCVYNLAAAYFLGLHKRRPSEWKRIRDRLEPATGDLFAGAAPSLPASPSIPSPPIPPIRFPPPAARIPVPTTGPRRVAVTRRV